MDKETNSRGRALVVPVAVVAGLGMAGVGLALSGVARAATTDVRSSTDTLNVNVQLSCTFNSVENKTYTGSANNGAEVGNFNDSGAHEFNFSCNDKDGYTVSATPYDLEATGIEDVIAYTDSYAPSGANGMWTAAISSNTAGVTVTPVVPVGGGTIISASSNTAAGGTTFTATYSAYVGTEMPAGTYSGTIVYTLISPGLSNGGGSGTGSGEINQNDMAVVAVLVKMVGATATAIMVVARVQMMIIQVRVLEIRAVPTLAILTTRKMAHKVSRRKL